MEKKGSQWKLVKVSDLPVPSREELEEAREMWGDKRVSFYVGSDWWREGKVYEITWRGEVKIAVWCDGEWVHGRVIRLEYVPRVLRLLR